jgi:hypothetical protein
MGNRFERKGTMASQIPKSMHWSYDTNFKLMVKKKNMQKKVTTAPQHRNSVSQNRMYDTGENKKDYSKEKIQPKKQFMGPSMGISMPLMRKFWSLC